MACPPHSPVLNPAFFTSPATVRRCLCCVYARRQAGGPSLQRFLSGLPDERQSGYLTALGVTLPKKLVSPKRIHVT